jgi:uncharacterized membrane protein
MENGVAILWKNALQLSGKMSCKKHILKNRYAKGEITKEDFDRIKSELR